MSLVPYNEPVAVATLVDEKIKISMLEHFEFFKEEQQGNSERLHALPYISELKTVIELICRDKSESYWYSKDWKETLVPGSIAQQLNSIPNLNKYFRKIQVAESKVHSVSFLYGQSPKKGDEKYEHCDEWFLLACWGKEQHDLDSLRDLAFSIAEKNIKKTIRKAKADFDDILDDLENEAKSMVLGSKNHSFSFDLLS